MKSTAELTIGELASRFGLATHVLRHWETVGLITPPRHGNGRRYYGEEHAARVAMILRGKQAGLSLEALAKVVGAETVADRRGLLMAHREELEAKTQELRASLELIDHALSCPVERYTQCIVFQELVQAQIDGDTLVLHRHH
jgi:DNA-binding transcriptional MerR regulator